MRRIVVALLVVLLLTGCTSGVHEVKNPETITYDFPVINCGEDEVKNNMLTYAGYVAYQNISNSRVIRGDIGDMYIGDRVLVYTVDENNKPVEKGAPYYYPIISRHKGMPYKAMYCVEIHTACGVKIENGQMISYNKPYSFTETDGQGEYLTSLTEDQMWNVELIYTAGGMDSLQYEKDNPNLYKKYAIYFPENEQWDKYVITEEKTIKLTNNGFIGQTEVEDDENTLFIREQLKNQPEYSLHPLSEYNSFPIKEVHILNNVISDEEQSKNVSKLNDKLKQDSNTFGLKLKTDGNLLNVWTVYVNTDLSITLFRNTNYYAVFNEKKYFNVYSSFTRDGEVYFGPIRNGVSVLLEENWNKLDGDSDTFLVVKGPHPDYNLVYNVVITENGEILSLSEGDTPEFKLYSDLAVRLKEYIGK